MNLSNCNKITVEQIVKQKGREKITMLTCYDCSFARLLDSAKVDIILVGDSLANVILGLDFTKEVSFREMFMHTKAVTRFVSHALVVADMPFVSYQKNRRKAVYYARRFLEHAKADAVKVEWFRFCPEVVRALVAQRIPVMGHIGLTPQTVDKLGGFKVQGKTLAQAQALIGQACELERLGVFSLVLECIPAPLGELITEKVSIPTIGIGAGSKCDGQVLVLYDMLGMLAGRKLRFVKQFADLNTQVYSAVRHYIEEVHQGIFPASEHNFSLSAEEYEQLKSYSRLGES